METTIDVKVVQGAKRDIATALKAAQERQVKAQKAFDKANQELTEANLVVAGLQTTADRFDLVFPEIQAAPRGRKTQEPKNPETQKAAPQQTTRKRRNANGGGMVASMKQVMGTNVMRAQEVVDALRTQGLLPKSKNPKAYVATLFSSHCEEDGERTFVAVARGQYKVANPVVTSDTDTTVTTPVFGAGSVGSGTNGSENPAAELLREQGVDLSGLDLPAAP
jgi:hypothetical protein